MFLIVVACMYLSKSPWRTSAMWHGTNKSNTSLPLPTQVAEHQCGTSARMTSSLKSATTATECVLCLHSEAIQIPNNPLALCNLSYGARSCVYVVFLDALLRVGLEPRSGNSAGLGFGGWPDASHPDVGFTFCYLSSKDFRESHTVNIPKTHNIQIYIKLFALHF